MIEKLKELAEKYDEIKESLSDPDHCIRYREIHRSYERIQKPDAHSRKIQRIRKNGERNERSR